MAIKQIGITTGGDIKEYQVETTDAENTYPTNCGAGSMLEIVDKQAKKIVGYRVYDGNQWNEV